MKTKEQALADLDKKTAEDRAAIEAKYAVLSSLPDLGEYAPPSVHFFKLYGSVGSVHFAIQRYASISEGKSPDVALLRKLMAEYPPQPTIMWKDGCTSFRPEPESYTSNGEATEVGPVVVDIDPGATQHTTVKWYGQISGQLWRFEVELPLHQPKLGRLELRFNRYGGDQGEVSSVACNEYYPVMGARHIRWGSGDRKTPGHHILYWLRDRDIDLPSVLQP